MTLWKSADGGPAAVHLQAADRPAAGIHTTHGQELCARGQRGERGRVAAESSQVALMQRHELHFVR